MILDLNFISVKVTELLFSCSFIFITSNLIISFRFAWLQLSTFAFQYLPFPLPFKLSITAAVIFFSIIQLILFLKAFFHVLPSPFLPFLSSLFQLIFYYSNSLCFPALSYVKFIFVIFYVFLITFSLIFLVLLTISFCHLVYLIVSLVEVYCLLKHYCRFLHYTTDLLRFLHNLLMNHNYNFTYLSRFHI